MFFGAGKYVELKNVNFTNVTVLSSQKVNQVIDGYFKNISSLNDFSWVAYFPKLKANGWTTKAFAENELKKLWKNALFDNAEQMFKTVENGGLGVAKTKQLFEFNNFTFNNSNQFKNLLNNNSQFRNNALNFIKVE